MAQRKTTKKKTPAKTAVKKQEQAKAAQEHNDASQLIWSICLLLIGTLVFIVTLYPPLMGLVGDFTHNILIGLLGVGGFLLPLVLIYWGILRLIKSERKTSRIIWCIIFILLFSAFFTVCRYKNIPLYGDGTGYESYTNYFNELTATLFTESYKNLTFGGLLGGYISMPIVKVCSTVGGGIIIFIAMFLSFIPATGISPIKAVAWLRKKNEERKERLSEIPQVKKEEKTVSAKTEGNEAAKKKKWGFIVGDKEEAKSKDDYDIEAAEIPFDNIDKDPLPLDDFDSLFPPIKMPGADQQTLREEDPLKNAVIKKVDSEIDGNDPLKMDAGELKATTDEISSEIEKNQEEILEYKKPPIDLLNFVPAGDTQISEKALKQTAQKLIEALRSFNVEAKIINICKGPAITRYELQPQSGVKISKITSLADDIALHLEALAVRIEAPIPGKAAIGIEIPNKAISIVYLRELIESVEFASSKSSISVCLGKDITGTNIIADLGKMPHLLIAGSTGSGKSVCINSLIISLLYHSSPDEVKLLLVDPKVVELNVYNGIPHLLIPVVTDPKKAAGALNWAVGEMLKRYSMFKEKNVRDFAGYNQNLNEGEKRLPQIVIIIDEMADLMMTAPTEVEDAVCRLAQMARAAGMHLVIATQRPSVNVITGTIKANVPSRIAFAVSSQIDSRIILDSSGAEKLVGKGDMLYDPIGATKPVRVQGCFVSDKEVEKVVEFVKENGQSDYDDDVIKTIEEHAKQQANGKKGAAANADGDDEEDVMLPNAIEVVVENGQASTSVLQRRLKLGYARAARIMDEMEQRGIIGPYQGSKPREVLLTKQQWYEMKTRGEE